MIPIVTQRSAKQRDWLLLKGSGLQFLYLLLLVVHPNTHDRELLFEQDWKAAVVASSIFDVVANVGKKEKKVTESPRKTRVKKSMIQSPAITNYFLKKSPKEDV